MSETTQNPEVNKVELSGNLGHTPECRRTKSGLAVTNFTLYVNSTKKDENGKEVKTSERHRVTVWSKIAENCCKYLTKGSFVTVTGRLHDNTWTDKQGVQHDTKEIVAQEVKFHSRQLKLPLGKENQRAELSDAL